MRDNPPEIPGEVTQLGIRDLRARLASHVRQAGSGHRIIVTVDGHPVAELGPVGGSRTADTIESLIATGLLSAPTRTDRPIPPDPTPMPAGTTSERALLELRGR